MLSCRDITELATSYTEGALSFGERLRFRMHLVVCRHCRRYVGQLRVMVDALGRVPRPAPAPSPEAREALLRQFRGWRKPDEGSLRK